MKAIWNNQVIAESDDTVVVENNHYFPDQSVNKALLVNSDTTTVCSWKGIANYYSLKIGDEINIDAAWYYAQPKPEAAQIKSHIAFWKGVEIV